MVTVKRAVFEPGAGHFAAVDDRDAVSRAREQRRAGRNGFGDFERGVAVGKFGQRRAQGQHVAAFKADVGVGERFRRV